MNERVEVGHERLETEVEMAAPNHDYNSNFARENPANIMNPYLIDAQRDEVEKTIEEISKKLCKFIEQNEDFKNLSKIVKNREETEVVNRRATRDELRENLIGRVRSLLNEEAELLGGHSSMFSQSFGRGE